MKNKRKIIVKEVGGRSVNLERLVEFLAGKFKEKGCENS